MRALENAKKLTSNEVIAKIASSGMKEYGVYQEALADRWKALIDHSCRDTNSLIIVAALNNSDTIGVLLNVLKENPEHVMEGMEIAAYALQAKGMRLQLPETAMELANEIKGIARERDIEIVTGFLDIRENRDHSLNHIVTMKNIYDLFVDQYEEGVYISLDGGKPIKYSNQTKLSEIVDKKDGKGFLIGHELYPVSVLDWTLDKFKVQDGRIQTLTEKECILHEVEEKLLAFRKQSCGKCVFCREGLIQLHGMAKDITDGKGKEEYQEIIKEIGSAMICSTPCSLGQESSKISLSSLEYFASEYEEHIKKKNCSASVCTSFQKIYIDPFLCEGCEECLDVCPVDCIEGKSGFIHIIDDFECTKCGKCAEVCEYDAIIQTSGRVPKLPDRMVKCGKFKKH